jgi:hypothetical protein
LTSIKDVNIYFFDCISIFFVILYYQGKQKNNVVLQVSSATFKNTKKWMQPFYNANDNDNLKKKKRYNNVMLQNLSMIYHNTLLTNGNYHHMAK